MKKILLISLDLLDDPFFDETLEFAKKMVFYGNIVAFYSRNESRLSEYESVGNEEGIYLKTRDDVKKAIKNSKNNYFVVIGKKDKDFELAVNNKLLFITPNWLGDIETKANAYGIKVFDYKQLSSFVLALNNQNTWYSKYKLDSEETHYFSLSDAKSRVNARSDEEKVIIEIFHNILKKGSTSYYNIYLYHFLSCISNNNNLFNDINYWGIFPSSSGKLKGTEMFTFREKVRIMMKGQPLRSESYQNYPNILWRHTSTTKSHYDPTKERLNYGAMKHFKTICLNPAYKGKLRGKNVCIFDDYLTHGNSFECARNLLREAGVNKIIFVTLGTFGRDYQNQYYSLKGDIYSPDYKASFIEKNTIHKGEFEINNIAKEEVENLYKIFNL